jgi:UDP-N-acetylglucosamine--N-acetylmuramyl-(pentapeptide) pyrophosphoryl-undecaprenol N-acetylglucosamine transferase
MPGLANRLVGKRVQAAAVNFPAACTWFNNCEVTGIPVRPRFFSIKPPAGAAPNLLVFGGSQGARILNLKVPSIAPALLEGVPELTILHQCGARNVEATVAAYTASGADPARWEVCPFFDDMPSRFAAARLVLARSGASTVAELAAAGKPALLGAAVLLDERELDDRTPGQPGKLLATLTSLLNNSARLDAMSTAARTQAHPGAAERIADRLAALAVGQLTHAQ